MKGEKQASDQGWAAFEYLEHPVFVLEPDSVGLPRYKAVNRFTCRLLQKQKADIIGHTAEEVFPGGLGRVVLEHQKLAFHTGMPNAFEVAVPVGQFPRLMLVNLSPELNNDGAAIRVFGSVTDLSGAQLVESVQLGMASIKSEIADFIGHAARDMDCPLQSVGSIASKLRDGFQDLGDGKLELIGLLEDIGERAMTLTSDILTFAQFSSPVQSTNRGFEFYDLVNEILLLLKIDEESNITCDQALVQSDRMVLQLVLRNLIEKVAKSTAKGQSLDLDFQASHREGSTLQVLMEIGGGQFDLKAQEFLNGGKTSAGSCSGLLGTRRLVHARGGSISVKAGLGRGSQVEVTLPGAVMAHEKSGAVLR